MKIVKIIYLFFFLSYFGITHANSSFDTSSSELFIPRVDVDGTPSFTNVKFKLNFSNNTFQIAGAESYPKTLFDTVIETTKSDLQEVTVGIRGCVKSSTNLVCHILITSDLKDQRIRIYLPSSFIVDNLANKYIPNKIEAGGVIDSKELNHGFIQGIPILHKLSFSNVSEEATSIVGLSLSIIAVVSDGINTTLKNININF